MVVKIENLISVWYDQIPTLFINLVNAIVLARDEKELREVIDHFHKNTSLKGMFAYGYGSTIFGSNRERQATPQNLWNIGF